MVIPPYRIGSKVWYHHKMKGLVIFSYKEYVRLCIQSLDGQVLYIDSYTDEIKPR